MVGVSRLVLNRRERAVLLKPREQGIVLWTLRVRRRVRDRASISTTIREAKPDPEAEAADRRPHRKKAWSPEMVADPVQERLIDIIEAKKKGAKKTKTKPSAEPEPPSNVHQHHGRAAPKRRRGQEDERALLERERSNPRNEWGTAFPGSLRRIAPRNDNSTSPDRFGEGAAPGLGG